MEEENAMSIDELNALHYTVAITLAGEQPPKNSDTQKERPDPDAHIKTKIEKVRKWIGRLTMANRNGMIKSTIKHILKGKSIQNQLQANKMKLAALTKKLRYRKSNRERYWSNKLHRHN